MGNGATGSTPGFGPGDRGFEPCFPSSSSPALAVPTVRDMPLVRAWVAVRIRPGALKWVQCQRSHAVLPCR